MSPPERSYSASFFCANSSAYALGSTWVKSLRRGPCGASAACLAARPAPSAREEGEGSVSKTVRIQLNGSRMRSKPCGLSFACAMAESTPLLPNSSKRQERRSKSLRPANGRNTPSKADFTSVGIFGSPCSRTHACTRTCASSSLSVLSCLVLSCLYWSVI